MPRFERNSQNRVARLFITPLAAGGPGYENLGNWSKRDHNRAIETALLRANLAARGYSPAHISAALQKLEAAVDVTGITPYQANLRTYPLLRYGTTGTPEQFFVQWKDEQPQATATAGVLLDRPLVQMCGKARLLDLIRNFVILPHSHVHQVMQPSGRSPTRPGRASRWPSVGADGCTSLRSS